jgi:Uma2 family endonuclease
MDAAAPTWTEAELMRFPRDGCKCELVHDELRLTRSGMDHARLGAALATHMGTHAAQHRLGIVCGPNLGCWMGSGNLRCPDLSFIAAARVPRTPEGRQGFFRGAPDLAVEIVALTDRPLRLVEKLRDYFESGTRLAWIINPAACSVVVHRTLEPDRLLRVTDALDGEDVLPGFRLPLAALFAELLFE